MLPRDKWDAYALPSAKKGERTSRFALAPSVIKLGGDDRPKTSSRTLRGTPGLTGPGFEERTAWVHVAPHGEWNGHAEGKFSLGPTDFDSIVAHDAERAAPISWDYEHASIAPTGGPTPAAGFVVEVAHEPDGLWARTEFTPRAATMIKDGEYKFCSGVFDFDSTDPVTGDKLPCVMDSVALTNRPFIAGMEPIALSKKTGTSARRAAAGEAMPMETKPTVPSVKFSRKMLDRALNELGTDQLNEASVRLVMDGLMAQARATAALAADDAPEVDADDDAEVDASVKPSARVVNTTPVANATPAPGAPQDPSQPPDIAPPTPSVSVPPTGAPGASEAGLAAALPPIPEDSGDTKDSLFADLLAATGLDEPGLLAMLREKMDALVGLLTGSTAPTTAEPSDEVQALVVSTLAASLREAKRQINVLETDRKALTRKAADKTAEEEVEALVKAGKIHPSKETRAPWVALAKNRKAFAAAAAQLEPVYPVGESQLPPPVVDPKTPASENVPPAVAADAIDETSEAYQEIARAADETDRSLQKMGLAPMSKERKAEFIATTLQRVSGKTPQRGASAN